MAEDGAWEDENQDQTKTRTKNKKKPQEMDRDGRHCNPRIEYLAIPKRRYFLSLFQMHGYHLPRDKLERLKQILQEMYAMTPEETERYFAHLQEEADKIAKRRETKLMLRKLVMKKKRQKQKGKAYKLFGKLIMDGMYHSFDNSVPPLVSVRLRNLADIILEQICDLCDLDIPNREKPDKIGRTLISFADWLAIAIEHLYYKVQLKKNEEMRKIEEEERLKPPKPPKNEEILISPPVVEKIDDGSEEEGFQE